jgi:hypothetical protein
LTPGLREKPTAPRRAARAHAGCPHRRPSAREGPPLCRVQSVADLSRKVTEVAERGVVSEVVCLAELYSSLDKSSRADRSRGHVSIASVVRPVSDLTPQLIRGHFKGLIANGQVGGTRSYRQLIKYQQLMMVTCVPLRHRLSGSSVP